MTGDRDADRDDCTDCTDSPAIDDPDAEAWEGIARETLWQVLTRFAADTELALDEVADTVYWRRDPDAEQVERLRQAVFDLRYLTEAYVARVSPDAEPWVDDAERTPSWQPASPPASASRRRDRSEK